MTLMGFFFSGVPVLVEIVNPEMNREWGLLENIQLIVVATIIGVSIYATAKKKPAIQKFGFIFIAIFGVFVFLEEIDYGSHLSQYLTGQQESQLAKLTGVYNVHNYGENTAKVFKRAVYVLMLLLFLVAPFVRVKFWNPIFSYLIPQPKIAIIAMITIVCELAARALVPLNGLKLDELGMDIGEFSEILVYYVFLLYVWQLVFEKQWAMTSNE
jgi:magnesium-transporting ATPase (P-type)